MTSTTLTKRPEHAASRQTAPVTWDAGAAPLLTAPLRALVGDFLDLLQRSSYAPITRTEIRGFQDPEEDVSQIVVRQWVALPAAEASASLEALGKKVEVWMETLPPQEKALFLGRIAFQLRRDAHADMEGRTPKEGRTQGSPLRGRMGAM